MSHFVLADKIIDMINIIFNRTGAAAAAIKCLCEFNMPLNNAVSDMKIIYGKIIRDNSTAKSKRSLPANPLAIA